LYDCDTPEPGSVIAFASMDVVSGGPFRVASLVWHNHVGTPVLTVAAKATFLLEQGESPLAPVQEPLNEEDNYWDDDPSRSLYSPSDLVPCKPRADVLLVGSAFAPRREPVRSLLVRLVVGEVDKAIEVFCDRWFTQDGQLREGSRFTKMPLRWERASRGSDASNPVGVRLEGPSDARGNVAISNLQPPGLYIARRGDFIPVIGYGPIASSWLERRNRLGPHRDMWSDRGWAERPLPEDIDRAYFHSAPQDQQVASLRDNERIILENLHAEHPRLVTSLPGLRPRAVVERSGAAAKEIGMRADTLWIDTDRSICTLTWHMQVRLLHWSEPGQIVISMARRGDGQPLAAPTAMEVDDAAQTMTPLLTRGPAMPFLKGDSPLMKPGSAAQAAHVPEPRTAEIPALEFKETTARWSHGQGEEGEDIEEISADLALEDVEPLRSGADDTMNLRPGAAGLRGQVLPFQVQAREDAEPRARAEPLPPPPAEVAPPALVRAPVSMEPVAPQVKASPWAGSDGRASGSMRGESTAAAVVAKELMTPMGQAPAATGGALSASNAAAGREAKRAEPGPVEAKVEPAVDEKPKALPDREVIRLLWFDAAIVPRMRTQAKWRRLLLESDLRPPEEGDEDSVDEEAEEAKARRHVFEVMTRGERLDMAGVREALAGATGKNGQFEPPLVLVAGEMVFPFDELETLKATVASVSPLVAGDKKLKDVIDTVQELLKTPWLEGSGSVAEGLTERVKEAFAQGKRSLPADHLTAHTERMLLHKRRYQKRTVFGGECIRSLLMLPGAGMEGVVAYLPEKLGKELPMVQRMRCRVLAEVEAQQDQYEAGAVALRVVGVGRAMRT
jgi:hypothetical protein